MPTTILLDLQDIEDIPLCVPITEKEEAELSGALYDDKTKVWHYPGGLPVDHLQKWLPLKYKNMLKPSLIPEFIPESSWVRDLEDLGIPDETFAMLRRKILDQSGNRCQICGTPTELISETWKFSTNPETQHLTGLQAICPQCEMVRDFPYLDAEAQAHATTHLAQVNGWSIVDARAYIEDWLSIWNTRSKAYWIVNLSWLRLQGIEF